MKKIFSSIVLLFIGFSLFAGNENADKVYNYLDNNHNAFSISLSKKMIDFFDLDIDLNGKEKWITGDFTKGRMMVINEAIPATTTTKMFLDEGFKLVDIEEEMDEDSAKVWLFVKRRGKNVAEAHFVVEEEESLILLSIYGDMNVSEKNQ